MSTFAAVDLGASSGRVMAARVGPGSLDLTELHRFPNEPFRTGGTLQWNVTHLYDEIRAGLARAGDVQSVGIDSWAVDYGLLDEDGKLLAEPVHYRDSRTDGITAPIPDEVLYARTGLAKQPFNTIYQLLADERAATAATMLLIPDLLTYWLTGEIGAERTNASTTNLLDLHTGQWATDLITAAGLRPSLFPPLRDPGSIAGPGVIAVGSHDTASAVVAVPAATDDFVYISCGTWSLVGVELDAPILTEASRRAGFTNEGGVDGTVRYLRNVMGLWPLQEAMRGWGRTDVADLLAAAAKEPAFAAVVDLDDPVFLPPGDVPARIAAACRATGQTPPGSPAGITRCIMDSLALAHRRAVREALDLSGRHADAVHIVGGGARNELLCRLTADACELPVLAGPVEATALGNVLVQARTAGEVGGDLAAMRELLRQTQAITRYEPSGDPARWRSAESRAGR